MSIKEDVMRFKHGNTVVYHFLLFISFMSTVYLTPPLRNFLTTKITQPWAVHALTYYLAFLIAFYALPTMLVLISKKAMEKEQ